MSRWFVGSSRIRRCGASMVARSSESRAFCPPESFAVNVSAWSAPRPKPASRARSRAGASVGPQAADVVERGLVGVELVELVLGEIADAELRGAGNAAAHGGELAREELRERRLPLPVAPQKRDAVVLVDAEVEFSQDRRAAVADRRGVEVDDRGRQLLGLGEGEGAQRRLLRAGDGRELLQHLETRLGLRGLRRLGAEPVDEALQMRAARLLLLGLRRLHGEPGRAGRGEGVVGALVERELAVLEVEDCVHGAVQEAPVVGDDEHRMRIAGEVRLQPERAFEVEVVRWLVEEEEIGAARRARPRARPASASRPRRRSTASAVRRP
jgi:hypothetical protein